MKRLTATIYLTLAVLLGGVGVSWGADLQKGFSALSKGDYATALRELKPLAEKGNSFAQATLAEMYGDGLGVEQNYNTAVKWWKLAAEQGNNYAHEMLGFMYAKGRGVIRDNVYAYMWLNVAAATGLSNAVKNLDILEKQMTTAQIAEAQKLARECVRKKYKGC